jgi:serine/threonine-protein kinase
MIDRCLDRQGDNNGLLLRKASILGLQARYSEAAQILIGLNQRLPRRRAILNRLVLVHEQMRDTEMAEAFRKALAKLDITAHSA